MVSGMSFKKILRGVAGLLAILVVAAAANYYLELGWFGSRGRFVLSVLLLLACMVVAIAIRNAEPVRRH
jgi:branched-subunit amino acid permease